MVLDHLTETQRRAYIIADDQIALNAGWNDEMLREQMASLDVDGFNLSLVGFSDGELTAILAGAGGCRRRRGGGGSRTSRAAGYVARGCVVDRKSPSDLWRLPGRRRHREVDGRRQSERGDHVAALRDAARVRSIERVTVDDHRKVIAASEKAE